MQRTNFGPGSALMWVVFLLGVSTASAQEFRNASFEDSIVPPGDWLYQPSSPQVIWTGTEKWGLANGRSSWGTGGHTGPQYAYLQSSNDPGPGTMSQAVGGFDLGSAYVVDYWMARRNGGSGGNVGTSLTVKVNRSEVIVDNEFSAGGGAWLPYTSQAFRATSEFNLFTFSVPPPTGDHSLLLDDLSIRRLYEGDANRDGAFDSSDLAAVFAVGKYDLDVDAGWSDGDWTGDVRFNSADLIAAMQTGAYEKSQAAAQVPEPSTGITTLIGLMAVHFHRRRERSTR
ncbi:MAG: hypothetical protein KDB23_24765 [Planctomycetales bacterium]|nr:hypothetical protein [Planctomycetales bacterium]